MKPKKVDLQRIAESLQMHCPFITFAMISGLDDEGWLKPLENVELSVLIDTDTGFFYALEKILPVMTCLVPDAFCEVTLLNRVDVKTRFMASNSRCLFIRTGQEISYENFVQKACLDYRIMSAQCRIKGIKYLD